MKRGWNILFRISVGLCVCVCRPNYYSAYYIIWKRKAARMGLCALFACEKKICSRGKMCAQKNVCIFGIRLLVCSCHVVQVFFSATILKCSAIRIRQNIPQKLDCDKTDKATYIMHSHNPM